VLNPKNSLTITSAVILSKSGVPYITIPSGLGFEKLRTLSLTERI